MKKVTRKMLRGFTLVELIIVMAVFGILMAGAIALVDPVSKIFKSANMSEKSYAYVNNIQTYLQGTLEYSDNMWIYTANNMDVDGNGSAAEDADILKLVEGYRQTYYKNLISYDGVLSKEKTTDGKIYVMHLKNSDRGKITVQEFDFNSHSPISYSVSSMPTEVDQLNKAFFDADDSIYSFKYAVGANSLVNVDAPAGMDGDYAALSMDFNNEEPKAEYTNLTLSILMSRSDGDYVPSADPSVYGYTAFERPCAVSVANFPLTNISYRTGNVDFRATLAPDSSNPSGYAEVGGKADIKMQTSLMLAAESEAYWGVGDPNVTGSAFMGKISSGTTDYVDLTQDIYVIYSYADELEMGS